MPMSGTRETTHCYQRKGIRSVSVSVAHAGAIKNQRVIEQAAVPVRSGAQFFDEFCELLGVIEIDAGVPRLLFGIVAMVGKRVVRFVDADLWISALAGFARHHE